MDRWPLLLQEEELLYRNYEILSAFYKKHFVDLRVLDTTCIPEETPPPQIENGYVKEYRTVENVLLQGRANFIQLSWLLLLPK